MTAATMAILEEYREKEQQREQALKNELANLGKTPEYAKQRIALVKQQPTPLQRKQFQIDECGFLYVDLLPDGRKLWVARWGGVSSTNKHCANSGYRQKTLGNFNELSYDQASCLEDAAMYPA